MEEKETDIFYLSFHKDCRPFNLPTYPTVALEARAHFQDADIIVQQKRIEYNSIYRIDTSKPHPSKGQFLSFDIPGVGTAPIKLEPEEGPIGNKLTKPRSNFPPRQGNDRERERGVLIAFKECNDKTTKQIV